MSNTMQFDMANMSEDEVNRFSEKLESIKEKYSESGKLCEFKIIDNGKIFSSGSRFLLEVNSHMVSAYILEQNT